MDCIKVWCEIEAVLVKMWGCLARYIYDNVPYCVLSASIFSNLSCKSMVLACWLIKASNSWHLPLKYACSWQLVLAATKENVTNTKRLL